MEQLCSSMLHKNTGGEGTTFRQPGIIEKLPASLAGKRLRGRLSKMSRVRLANSDLPDRTKHSLAAPKLPSQARPAQFTPPN